jgi:hypothetical protein
MSSDEGLDRRNFFQRVGGGVVVLVSLGPDLLLAQDAKRLYPEDFNAFRMVGVRQPISN